MAEHSAERPLLIVTSDKFNEQVMVEHDNVVIGRDEGCDLVIPDRQISRRHIRLYFADGGYFIEDLESRNGTWVNDQQLHGSRPLYNNDVIMLATTVRLQFVASDATAPAMFAVPPHLTDGRLRLEREARRVFLNGVELDPPLSPPQYRLLELLYMNPGRICTREQVIESVWPDAIGEGVSEQAIDALVRRLRDRLAEVDPDWQYIVTVRGHGFRLDLG